MTQTQHEEAAIQAGRNRIAALAEKDGEVIFARQVRAGCWDHRRDVSVAIRKAKGEA